MAVVSPSPAEKRHYHFDGFLVDPVRRLLIRDGELVVITPKSFSVLLILLEYRGEVVEKDELLRRIWPDTFVTEANLTQNISALRKALGERANENRYVVTAPGRGYSFVAEVSEIAVEERSSRDAIARIPRMPAEDPESAMAPPRSGRDRRGLMALLVLVLAAAIALSFALFRGKEPAPAVSRTFAGARPSIAVLGLENLSGSPGSQWLGSAFSEMLATELAVGGRVRVVTGETVARARQSPDLQSLGPDSLRRLHRILGCDLLVVGSYLPLAEGAGERIRLDLRVLRMPGGDTVASLAQEGTEPELFELVSQAGSRLRQALGFGELSPGQVQEARALQPVNSGAARLYSLGLEELRAFNTPRALELLKQAAAADPASAPVRDALAQAWSVLGHDTKAVEEARRAVDLAAALPRRERLAIEAHYHAASRAWSRASELYRSLWTFYPDDLEYGLPLVASLYEGGKGAEALAIVAALRKLPAPTGQDPRIDLEEARALRRLSDLPGTLRAAQAAKAKGRESGESMMVAQALVIEGGVLLIQGTLEPALRHFHEARMLFEQEGHDWGVAIALAHVGLTLSKQGDLEGAEKTYHEVLGIAESLGNVSGIAAQLGNLGLLYQSRGDLRQAQTYLERSRARFAEIEDPLLESRVLSASFGILLSRGDLDGAESRVEEVLVLSRKVGSRADEARALSNLGILLAWRGELAQSLRQQEAALQTLREYGDLAQTASALAASAEALSRLGDLPTARKRCEEARAMKERAGDRVGMGQVLGSLALLEYRTGNLAASRASSEEQRRVAAETGSRSVRAWGLHGLGRVELAAGNLTKARASLDAALAESLETGEELRAMMVRVDLARLAVAQEDYGTAESIAGASAAWWHARHIPLGEARALMTQAGALMQLGRLDEARGIAARVRSLTGNSEDRDLALVVAPELARIEAVGGNVERALSSLRQASGEARRSGFVAADMEARLASGEIEMRRASPAGLASIQALRIEAEKRGYGQLARRAGKVLREAGRS